MLEVIRRVISGEDFQSQTQSHDQESIGMQIEESSSANQSPQAPSSSEISQPAIVENDIEMDTSDFHIASLSETPRSSLSDVSAAQRLEAMDDGDSDGIHESEESQEVQQPISDSRGELRRSNIGQQAMQSLRSFARSDSRMTDKSSSSSSVDKTGSSQTSSRDWGWFEDVHTSEGTLGPDSILTASSKQRKEGKGASTAARRKGSRSSKKVGLVPSAPDTIRNETLQPIVQRDPETDAAAMAVTAPNYVLEESLSSQRLWKDTAGQRPPQPVEERAFFEKMWAQNFARSQVAYRLPVEVLTATTPISMSPFADGNFDSQAEANQLSNYNLAVPTSSTDEAAKQSNVAEGVLVRNMHDPNCTNHGTIMGSDAQNAEMINRKIQAMSEDGETLTVMIKGSNVFGTTVSKAFARPSENGGPISGVDTVNISIASYRVVESKKHGKYAQFLVIYREGSIRDTVGVWKRYSDFQELSKKVTQAHEGCAAVIANMSPLAVAEEHEVEHLPNAITSWRLLKKRQRWYRCLDAGYLSLKVFLLERFLHDILFESSSPDLLRDFVGASDVSDD